MLTTICSACSTEFRVTPEQLRLRGGRVRCGKCETVFDALVSLTQRNDHDGKPQSTSVTFDPGPAEVPDIPGFQSDYVPVAGMTDFTPLTGHLPAAEPAMPVPTADRDEPKAADIVESVSDGIEAPADPAAVPPAAQSPFEWPVIGPVDSPAPEAPAKNADFNTPATVAAAIPGEHPKAVPPPPAPAGPPPAFEFGPQAQPRRSRWWGLLCGVFLLALIAQGTFYFRGAIAFLIPETKPYIFAVCAELGCEIPLPRRAELISIETSDLQADPTNPGVIVLAATLRNRAAFPQTFPALELTLTNERDQPLARRVLQAGDYLADKTEAFEGSSEKQIRLNIEAGSVKASGYRLYLFYP